MLRCSHQKGGAMKIKDYLYFNRIYASEFAKMVEITPTYMRHICNRKIIPSKKIAKRIELLTGGEVSVEDIMGEDIPNTTEGLEL